MRFSVKSQQMSRGTARKKTRRARATLYGNPVAASGCGCGLASTGAKKTSQHGRESSPGGTDKATGGKSGGWELRKKWPTLQNQVPLEAYAPIMSIVEQWFSIGAYWCITLPPAPSYAAYASIAGHDACMHLYADI